jgi:hypothetical protein
MVQVAEIKLNENMKVECISVLLCCKKFNIQQTS